MIVHLIIQKHLSSSYYYHTKSTHTIMMKLAVIAALAGSATAFAPAQQGRVSSVMFETAVEEAVAETVQLNGVTSAPAVTPINGWVPDTSLPLLGLPGASLPLGYFDPLGFGKGDDVSGIKRLREAEVMHSRVAMMATVGYLIGESTPTITYGMDVHHTIANNQIPEIPGTVMFPFFLAINICEAWRASAGWVEPGLGPLFSLRENYYPGEDLYCFSCILDLFEFASLHILENLQVTLDSTPLASSPRMRRTLPTCRQRN